MLSDERTASLALSRLASESVRNAAAARPPDAASARRPPDTAIGDASADSIIIAAATVSSVPALHHPAAVVALRRPRWAGRARLVALRIIGESLRRLS